MYKQSKKTQKYIPISMSQTISKHVPHWNCLRAPDDSYWTKSSEHTVPFFFALTRTFESGLSLNFCPNVFTRSWHFERNPDTCLCIKSYLAAPTQLHLSNQHGSAWVSTKYAIFHLALSLQWKLGCRQNHASTRASSSPQQKNKVSVSDFHCLLRSGYERFLAHLGKW